MASLSPAVEKEPSVCCLRLDGKSSAPTQCQHIPAYSGRRSLNVATDKLPDTAAAPLSSPYPASLWDPLVTKLGSDSGWMGGAVTVESQGEVRHNTEMTSSCHIQRSCSVVTNQFPGVGVVLGASHQKSPSPNRKPRPVAPSVHIWYWTVTRQLF